MRDAELILADRQLLQAKATVFVGSRAGLAIRQQVADEDDISTRDGFAVRPHNDAGKRSFFREGDARPQHQSV